MVPPLKLRTENDLISDLKQQASAVYMIQISMKFNLI